MRRKLYACGCLDCHCDSPSKAPICGFCTADLHRAAVICVHPSGKRHDITERGAQCGVDVRFEHPILRGVA